MPVSVPTSVPMIRVIVESIAEQAAAILAGLPAEQEEEEPTTPPEPISDPPETALAYFHRTQVLIMDEDTYPIAKTHVFTGSGWVPG